MRKSNKKGFTIVELVIVIAVIAILAAVLIPTFAGMVKKANESAALQAAEAALKTDLIIVNSQPTDDNQTTYKKTADTALTSGKTYYTKSNGVYTAVQTPDVANIGDYYEVDEDCVGAFTDITANGYTYTVEVDGYTAVFKDGEWKVTKNN